MKKAKKKGKSYSQGWFERQSRRFMGKDGGIDAKVDTESSGCDSCHLFGVWYSGGGNA